MPVTNIIIAGLGGQGVLKASDILADVIFAEGLDIKKSEVHGMAQRGGSVACDIRYGDRVLSPMVPPGESDFVVVIAPDQVEVHRGRLRPGGTMIEPSQVDAARLRNARSINVALLGALSRHLPFTEEAWLAAVRANLDPKLHAANEEAFALGRQSEMAAQS
jgi:indolepyruvate ferredoxin oxidoreductase beta subunit